MAQVLFPTREPSPTSVPGQADPRSQLVYSSIVFQNGGGGTISIFTNPKGQTIPTIGGSSTAPTSNHQVKYTSLTTSLEKAGELGSLGNASIKGIAVDLENAYVTASTGALNTYGGGQQEICEIIGKCFFELKVGGTKLYEAAVRQVPGMGGPSGAVSTTANAATVSYLSNGWPGAYRRLRMPVLAAWRDTLEVVMGVAGSDTLAFSVSTGVGQPVLATMTWDAALLRDPR